MKTSKISLVVVLALALTLGLAASSWARPGGGMGGGKGCGMMGAMNLTPDQAGKFFDLKEKFRNDTAAVRKQMMVKHAELAALKKAEKPDQAAIDAKQTEIKALWDQMKRKERLSRRKPGRSPRNWPKVLAAVWAAAWAMAGSWYGWPRRRMGPGGCPMVTPGGAPAPAAPAK